MSVKANARSLAAALVARGYIMATGGTDNHLVLWDLRPLGITGAKYEKVCDEVCITLNKNSIYGDRSAISPGGVRVGTPALTSRGFTTSDFEAVAGFLHEAVGIAVKVQTEGACKTLAEFVAALTPATGMRSDVAALRLAVNQFASKFPMPGFDAGAMKFKTLE